MTPTRPCANAWSPQFPEKLELVLNLGKEQRLGKGQRADGR